MKENLRIKIIKGKKYIERTKDFYIQEGLETQEHFVKAIKRRESLGGKLN
jgi:hypothetical protein